MRGASHLMLLLQGYAILNDATIPIVGNPETVNNTYLEQLVVVPRLPSTRPWRWVLRTAIASASAAIATAVS